MNKSATEQTANTETQTGAEPGADNTPAPETTPNEPGNEFSTLSDYYERGDEDDDGDASAAPDTEVEEQTEGEEPGQETEPKSTEPKEPAAPQQTTEPPAATPEQQPAQPDASSLPAQEAQGQQPGQTPQQDPGQQQPQLTPEQWQQQVQQWHDQAVDVLSKQVYQLSDEDFEAYEADPRQALPKLAARVHVQAMQAAMMKTLELVPQVIQHHMSQQRTVQDFETEFYGKWPTLRKADANRVGQVIEVYRNSLNGRRPTREELINEVGQLAHAVLKIPLAEPTQQQPAQTPAPQPFQPAAAQQSPARAPGGPRNEFEVLYEQIESGEVDY